MGIIGVVAALTIPNLNSSTADKEKVAKLQKVYSNLNDAFGRATAVYGPLEDWFVNDAANDSTVQSERFMDRMKDFLKISKDCGYDEKAYCMTDEWKTLDGESDNSNAEEEKVILADGTVVDFYIYKNCNSNDSCGFVYLDLDGIKGANTNGKDCFVFDITKDGIVPKNNINSCFAFGTHCSGWVINNGNMDYLKADRKGKCPNGKQLSETVTSCK